MKKLKVLMMGGMLAAGICQLVISAFFPGRGILIGPHIALALQGVEQWVQGAGFQFKDVVGFAAKSFDHFVAVHIFRFQKAQKQQCHASLYEIFVNTHGI